MSGPVRSRQVDRSLDDIILEQQQRAGRRGGGRVPSDSRAPAPRSQPYSRAPQEMYPDRPHTQQSNTSTRGPPRGFSQLEPLPPRDDPRAQRRSAQGQEQPFREPERSRGGQRLEEWGRDGGGGQRGGRQQGGRDEGYGDERQDRRQREPEDLPEDADLPPNSFKVGALMDARGVASRVVALCEEGGEQPPALLTIGHPSINQAVKAIAIARTQMAESGTQLIFQPAFRHPDGLRPFIAFYIAVQPARRAMAQDNEVTLNSAASSNAKALAGAIAGKVRENRKVSITAVGIDAVANMVLAVGNARIYLEENNLDIKVEPRFETQQKNGTDLTVMVFDLISERI
ncbi:MAG: hypothetical protein WDW36_001147 [Sanguina aurantia]